MHNNLSFLSQEVIFMSTLHPQKLWLHGFIAILIVFFNVVTSPTNAAYVSLANQFLIPHNNVRRALGLRPLVWDARLANYAQNYANSRKRDCALIHSSGPFGENIFWGSGWGWTPAQAVGAWVAERRWYNPYANSCLGQQCGHYTQVVWRGTRRLGCALVNCYNGRGVFITCNYDPAGNYYSEKPY